MKDILEKITAKHKKLNSLDPLPNDLLKNLDQWFKIELTYTSNAIEGNTLTRQETEQVVEKGLTVGGKSLTEHLEALNHAQAFEFIKGLIGKKREEITEQNFLNIHSIILNKIDDTNAGRYRHVSVRIAGSTVIMPNPFKIPFLMSEFIGWLHGKNKDHFAKIAADAHFKFVSIHPFIDGNGRTARLLMNLLLMQQGYPAAIIKKEDRLEYINAIEKGQLHNQMDDYYSIIYKSVEASLDIYLNTFSQSSAYTSIPNTPKAEKLLKIGQLAKATGESVATVRFWTKEKLLEINQFSSGGYQLYDPLMIERAQKIRQLQKEKRLSIKEIKQELIKS